MSDRERSVLGPLKERVKTDIRIPDELSEVVDDMSRKLGVPKNAFYVIGAGLLAARLSAMGIHTDRKRDGIVDALEGELKSILAEIKRL